MDINQARALAEKYLRENGPQSPSVALFDDEFVHDHGWCYEFPWNTVRFIETRDLADIIGPGLGPIVVVKESGDTWLMGGFPDPDQQLANYAAEHGISTSDGEGS
ncbi:YrhB domain-containing protein [Spirillospora sp. NPDC047279]|uniref:YrhB domain-containing protein n=1 Tax=Spirillospora sp. NPDC047279 TaxID=3155478 RepID=UPI0033DD3C74